MWLLTIGVLGLIPVVYVLSSLWSIDTNNLPGPETWQWKVTPADLRGTFLALLVGYCVVWGGWIISAAAIYFGRWWGWTWAMSLCFSVFAVGIDLFASYAPPFLSLLVTWGIVGTCSHALTRPVVMEHCGITGSNRRQVYRWLALGVAICAALYYVGKDACERMA